MQRLADEAVAALARLRSVRPRSFEWHESSALITSLDARVDEWTAAFGGYRFDAERLAEGLAGEGEPFADARRRLEQTDADYRVETLTAYEELRDVFGLECEFVASTAPPPTATASPAPTDGPTSPPPTCRNPSGFSVDVPAGWFVHPQDSTLAIAECRLFAARTFEAMTRDFYGFWRGAQIDMQIVTGCHGSFEGIGSSRDVVVDGFNGRALELVFSESPRAGEISGYEYIVYLRSGAECSNDRWFIGQTRRDAVGSYKQNRGVLDGMMRAVEFDT
ncbi:MAG: hypothetical protein M3295_09225 [Chloroflexota bacterium]|nr:hypothetical protein [Chloroflexota bacterium]